MPKANPALLPEEEKALAAEAVKRMNEVRQALANPQTREDYLDFIIDFTACEVGYKTLLESYLKSRGKACAVEDLKIYPNQVSHVLKYADIDLDKDDIKTIFNKYVGKTRKHQARGMRNALTHEPTSKDLSELAKRKQDYMVAMQRLISAINNEAQTSTN